MAYNLETAMERISVLEAELAALSVAVEREACAEIADAVGITHSAASHQLAGLEARGIVTSHRMGQTMCYNLTNGNTTNHIKKLMLIAI